MNDVKALVELELQQLEPQETTSVQSGIKSGVNTGVAKALYGNKATSGAAFSSVWY